MLDVDPLQSCSFYTQWYCRNLDSIVRIFWLYFLSLSWDSVIYLKQYTGRHTVFFKKKTCTLYKVARLFYKKIFLHTIPGSATEERVVVPICFIKYVVVIFRIINVALMMFSFLPCGFKLIPFFLNLEVNFYINS